MIDGAGDDQAAGLTVHDVVGFSAALRGLGAHLGAAAVQKVDPGDSGADGCADLIDQIRCLEELKSAASAAQARATTRFAAAQRTAQRTAGVRARDAGQGIATQVALARRDSPVKGSRHLGLAEALCREMPHTLAALEAGDQ
ncbi:hypothetical protein BH20ACT6_BH20ACT6_01080 [soil metagenome]